MFHRVGNQSGPRDIDASALQIGKQPLALGLFELVTDIELLDLVGGIEAGVIGVFQHVRNKEHDPIVDALLGLHILAHLSQRVHDLALGDVLAGITQRFHELFAKAVTKDFRLCRQAGVQTAQFAHVDIVPDLSVQRHIQLPRVGQAKIFAWQEGGEGIELDAITGLHEPFDLAPAAALQIVGHRNGLVYDDHQLATCARGLDVGQAIALIAALYVVTVGGQGCARQRQRQ
ncbi:hypothetical protein D3C84_802440 [compost metagenome]